MFGHINMEDERNDHLKENKELNTKEYGIKIDNHWGVHSSSRLFFK